MMRKLLRRASAKSATLVDSLLRTKSVYVPSGEFFGWLGLNPERMRGKLREHRYALRCGDAQATSRGSQVPLADPGKFRDIIQYWACIATEQTPLEMERSGGIPAAVHDTIHDGLAKTRGHLLRECERARPSLCGILQGYEPTNGVARVLASEMGIPVIAFENTARKDRLLWDDISAITVNKNQAKNHYWKFRDILDPRDSSAYCDEFMKKIHGCKSAEHLASGSGYDRKDRDKPCILFLGQVYTDSSVVFGLREWESPVEVIRELCRISRKRGYQLLVKLHPKESQGVAPITLKPYNKLTHRKIMADPEIADCLQAGVAWVDADNSCDTYSMMDSADVAVTVNSQAGLEAATRGVPTVVCGSAFYDRLGFTMEADNPVALDLAMDRLIHAGGEKRASMRTEARHFLRIFYENYCIARNEDSLAALIAAKSH